jgi:hypothetical protein
MTTPERGRDGLREAIEALAWAPDLSSCGVASRDYDGCYVSNMLHRLRCILAEHPATGDEERCRYVMHGPGDTCDCRARLARVTTHTRTSTNGNGPDYCAECSSAISEWVPWPCPGATTPPVVPDAREGEGPSERDALIAALTFDEPKPLDPAMRDGAGEIADLILTSDWLAAHVAKAKAEALREAADALDLPGSDASGYYASEAVGGYREAEQHVETWLRDRADRIEGTR